MAANDALKIYRAFFPRKEKEKKTKENKMLYRKVIYLSLACIKLGKSIYNYPKRRAKRNVEKREKNKMAANDALKILGPFSWKETLSASERV